MVWARSRNIVEELLCRRKAGYWRRGRAGAAGETAFRRCCSNPRTSSERIAGAGISGARAGRASSGYISAPQPPYGLLPSSALRAPLLGSFLRILTTTEGRAGELRGAAHWGLASSCRSSSSLQRLKRRPALPHFSPRGFWASRRATGRAGSAFGSVPPTLRAARRGVAAALAGRTLP